MSCNKLKYWELNPKKRNLTEWNDMPVDWVNESKLDWVKSYFFRYDNYILGKKNMFILKSTFGNKSDIEIKEDINKWFSICVGAYSETTINV